jgi:hypothetical protein
MSGIILGGWVAEGASSRPKIAQWFEIVQKWSEMVCKGPIWPGMAQIRSQMT